MGKKLSRRKDKTLQRIEKTEKHVHYKNLEFRTDFYHFDLQLRKTLENWFKIKCKLYAVMLFNF